MFYLLLVGLYYGLEYGHNEMMDLIYQPQKPRTHKEVVVDQLIARGHKAEGYRYFCFFSTHDESLDSFLQSCK